MDYPECKNLPFSVALYTYKQELPVYKLIIQIYWQKLKTTIIIKIIYALCLIKIHNIE